MQLGKLFINQVKWVFKKQISRLVILNNMHDFLQTDVKKMTHLVSEQVGFIRMIKFGSFARRLKIKQIWQIHLKMRFICLELMLSVL